MFGQRRRRWFNIKTALVQRLLSTSDIILVYIRTSTMTQAGESTNHHLTHTSWVSCLERSNTLGNKRQLAAKDTKKQPLNSLSHSANV